jgi:hypothetical protein
MLVRYFIFSALTILTAIKLGTFFVLLIFACLDMLGHIMDRRLCSNEAIESLANNIRDPSGEAFNFIIRGKLCLLFML